MSELLLYNIGITLLPGIGNKTAKNIIAYCGSAERAFKEKTRHLEKIPGVGTSTAKSLTNSATVKEALDRAKKEIEFIEKKEITPLFFTDTNYPFRLKQCDDGPIMIYTKGKMNTNIERVLSVVGSRKATVYGKKICEQFLDALANYNVSVISGLAYGIDICAHRTSLKNKLPVLLKNLLGILSILFLTTRCNKNSKTIKSRIRIWH